MLKRRPLILLLAQPAGALLLLAFLRLLDPLPALIILMIVIALLMAWALCNMPSFIRRRCYICDAGGALPMPRPTPVRFWRRQKHDWVCPEHVRTWLLVQLSTPR